MRALRPNKRFVFNTGLLTRKREELKRRSLENVIAEDKDIDESNEELEDSDRQKP